MKLGKNFFSAYQFITFEHFTSHYCRLFTFHVAVIVCSQTSNQLYAVSCFNEGDNYTLVRNSIATVLSILLHASAT